MTQLAKIAERIGDIFPFSLTQSRRSAEDVCAGEADTDSRFKVALLSTLQYV